MFITKRNLHHLEGHSGKITTPMVWRLKFLFIAVEIIFVKIIFPLMYHFVGSTIWKWKVFILLKQTFEWNQIMRLQNWVRFAICNKLFWSIFLIISNCQQILIISSMMVLRLLKIHWSLRFTISFHHYIC